VQAEQARRDFEMEKCRVEHKYRMRGLANEDENAGGDDIKSTR